MHRLTKAIINKPVTVIVSLVGLVLFAIVSIRSMSLKLMPNINLPMLAVTCTYTGASPEEVDENLMEKIREACSTVAGLKKAQTQSYENYGSLMMQYDYGTDMSKTIDTVRNKLEAIQSDLPSAAGKPIIIEMDADAMSDISLSLDTESADIDLLKLVENTLEPELRRASALADISISGGDERYIAIRINPEYMDQYGISSASLVAAIQSVNFAMPSGSFEYGIQHLNMETEVHYKELDEIRQIPIKTAKGQTIHLYDVADISYGVADETSRSRFDGNETINLSIKRKQSSTAVELSRQVMEILENFEERYPDVNVHISYDSADKILETLLSVAKTMVEGIVLAMIVIFIFFGDLKGSIIVGTTMPISLLAALVCMYFMGISLNVVSMNALVISIGMITDNAVVVIEMCFKRQEEGYSFKDAAYLGSKTVMNSVIGSTITTVVVYLPLAVMNGLSGQMFKEMGFSIVFVLTASLISAITFVPFFFSVYKPQQRQNNPVTTLINRIGERYGRLLDWILSRKKMVTFLAVAIFVISMGLGSRLGTELMASMDEGIVNMDVTFRPNLTLDVMDEIVKDLEKFVQEKGITDRVSSSITQSQTSATITTYRKEDVDTPTQEIVDAWNTELADFSQMCEVKVSAGSSTMGALSSGVSREIQVVANTMEELRVAAAKIENIMRTTPGVIQVNSSLTKQKARAMVDVDPELASAKGLSALQVAQMVYANMNGTKAGEVTLNKEKYDIKVEYPKGYFENLDDVQSMTLMNSQGQSIPLTEIADIRMEQSSEVIVRNNGRFMASLTAVTTDEYSEDVNKYIDEQIARTDLGAGANIAESFEDQMMDEEFAAIGQAIVIALYLVFMVMAMQFESTIYSLLIMLCIPFALIGSVLMLMVMKVKISMPSLLGVLMLAGIVVNNGIIYVDTVNQFREAGEEVRSALIHAGKDRLRPILITTLTTELSMIPVAFKLAKNSETMQGMGIVIMGGLFASTILTLLLIPTFYLIVDKLRHLRKKKPQDPPAQTPQIQE